LPSGWSGESPVKECEVTEKVVGLISWRVVELFDEPKHQYTRRVGSHKSAAPLPRLDIERAVCESDSELQSIPIEKAVTP
jgi:hypothetical protein